MSLGQAFNAQTHAQVHHSKSITENETSLIQGTPKKEKHFQQPFEYDTWQVS